MSRVQYQFDCNNHGFYPVKKQPLTEILIANQRSFIIDGRLLINEKLLSYSFLSKDRPLNKDELHINDR